MLTREHVCVCRIVQNANGWVVWMCNNKDCGHIDIVNFTAKKKAWWRII